MTDANIPEPYATKSMLGEIEVPAEIKESVQLGNLDQLVEGLAKFLDPLSPLLNLARANSVWPLTFGTSCCAIEMMSVGMSKFDILKIRLRSIQRHSSTSRLDHHGRNHHSQDGSVSGHAL